MQKLHIILFQPKKIIKRKNNPFVYYLLGLSYAL